MLGRRPLDFAENATYIESVHELTQLFQSAIEDFGLDTFACGPVPSSRDPAPDFHAIQWPKAFADAYVDLRLHRRDPVLRAVTRGDPPSTWSELESRHPEDFDTWHLLNAIRESGWNEGFFVPVLDNGAKGCIGFAGPTKTITDDRRDRAALIMMSNMFYHYVGELRYSSTESDTKDQTLTPRQIEALHWVAAGLSDSEISEKLHISEATAHFHVENAKRRLEAGTRSQAVAIAVKKRLLRP